MAVLVKQIKIEHFHVVKKAQDFLRALQELSPYCLYTSNQTLIKCKQKESTHMHAPGILGHKFPVHLNERADCNPAGPTLIHAVNDCSCINRIIIYIF